MGCARIKIWGPKLEGKKKDCTVQISKMEGQPTISVRILNKTIVQPLIDHLPCNADTKNAIKSLSKSDTSNKSKSSTDEDSEEESKSSIARPKCEPCEKEFLNIRTLRKHERDDHPTQRKAQLNLNQSILSGQKKKKQTKSKKNEESPPRKLRVLEVSIKENENKIENDDMEVDKESLEDKVVNLQEEIEKMKTKHYEDEYERNALKKTINKLIS